ncbi:MAG: helix-turn-helix domain-containing protein [Pseudonocardiaceae bacterium]
MRAALARHDFRVVYRTLTGEAGFSQRRIADLTGQAQSEVSEILSGRRVLTYAVLARIVGGLGIPAALAGLSWYGPDGEDAYPGSVPVAESTEEAEVEMLRRHLMALGAIATFGAPITGLGELVTDPHAPALPVDLPGRIGTTDVQVIRGYTDHLRALARMHGGQARPAVALTQWADRWLDADASDTARRALLGALSDLHTITAWACHDVGAVARSHYHFGRALELANDAGDGYRAAYAMRHAAMMFIERSEPNDGLKLTQLAGLRLSATASDDAQVPVLQAWCHVVGALALSRLDEPTDSTRGQARTQVAQARDGWEPPHAHARGDMDLISGLTYLHLGELDAAEAALASSARTFAQSTDRREGVVADTTLALVHVQAGDSRGLAMAKDAITAVSRTKSGNARQLWLVPLAEALEARPGGDARDLARTARQVAATHV